MTNDSNSGGLTRLEAIAERRAIPGVISQGNVEKSRQRRSRLFAVLTY